MRDLAQLRVVAALLSWHLGGAVVKAQGAPMSLVWDAPPECPSQQDVEASVLRQLGSGRPAEKPVAARAVVRRDDGEFALVLALRTGDEEPIERQVRASMCSTLAETTALLVALAVDPELSSETEAAPPAALDQPASSPESPSPEAPRNREGHSTPPPSSERLESGVSAGADDARAGADGEPLAWRLSVGASLSLDVGLLPHDPAFGVAPELNLQVGLLLAHAALSFWVPQTAQLDAPFDARSQLETSALVASGHVCLAFDADAVTVGPCAAVDFGAVDLRTIGIDSPESASGRWIALGAGALAQFRLPLHLLGLLSATAYSPLTRPRFFVRSDSGEVDVHTASALDLRCSLGIAYILRE